MAQLAIAETQHSPSLALSSRISSSARRSARFTRRLVRERVTAIAAALLLMLLPASLLIANEFKLRGQLATTNYALQRIATSHFSHVAFRSMNGSSLVAKVLYQRHGAWFYIIVSGGTAFDVYGRRKGSAGFLGTTSSGNDIKTLMVTNRGRFDIIELRSRNALVGEAKLQY